MTGTFLGPVQGLLHNQELGINTVASDPAGQSNRVIQKPCKFLRQSAFKALSETGFILNHWPREDFIEGRKYLREM